jgi:hypothetical protein
MRIPPMRLRFVRRRALDIAVLFVFALASLYLTARVGLGPRDPERGVGVVFAPWTSGEAALRRAVGAGARFVRYGGVPFVVVVVPEERGYLARIAADGALLVVDPQALAACLKLFSNDHASDDRS